METKKIYDLHAEHVSWLNKLAFYRDDLKIFESRLGEVVKQNTKKELLARAEHFQNQFILQKEQIDILKHEIKLHESAMEKNIKENSTAVDHRKVQDHTGHREKMLRFEELFHDLRREYYTWLSEVF